MNRYSGARIRAECLFALAFLLAALVVAGTVLLDAETEVVALLEWVKEQTFWSPLLFVVVYAFSVVLLLPGLVFTLGAGFLFGVLEGSALVVIGETLGATAAFLIGRRLFGTGLAAALAKHPRFSFVNEQMRKDGWKVILCTRLIPFFPFKLSNYFFGLARYPFWGFGLGTLFGIIPFTLINVYLGSLAADLATLGARPEERSMWEWTLHGGVLLCIIAAAIYLAHVARRILRDLKNDRSPSPGSDFRLFSG